jgi:hypothetical protein
VQLETRQYYASIKYHVMKLHEYGLYCAVVGCYLSRSKEVHGTYGSVKDENIVHLTNQLTNLLLLVLLQLKNRFFRKLI